MKASTCLLLLIVFIMGASACASAKAPAAPPPKPPRMDSQAVFEHVAPSIVGILNDDRDDRDAEIKRIEKALGKTTDAPKHVIDVSLRKEPQPHGTGFMIESGRVVTAAHVVLRPDRLKISTRDGQVVDADVDRIDEVRDIALLKPRHPLKGVPPLELEQGDVKIGEPVWALGHTGRGLWSLSYGISEGIASGVVDMLGVKLLVFDAVVYPGFSGGPVVSITTHGHPHVVGVNHAILFTGASLFPVASISSATAISELREVVAGHPHPIQEKLRSYVKEQRNKVYADLFITQEMTVQRDINLNTIASIHGSQRVINTRDGQARVPVAAMIFNLSAGEHSMVFDLLDPDGKVLDTDTRPVVVGDRQRVTFTHAFFDFKPSGDGRYKVQAKLGDKRLGEEPIWIEVPDDEDGLSDPHDTDSAESEPDVDIVVAEAGNEDPLMLDGIRSSWIERSYPRRVSFAWFARGSRGWTGTNALIKAFVLDENGTIVGAEPGCFKAELRPELSWSCMNTGGTPLANKEGPYDIVFTINDRPVATWPMEAVVSKDDGSGGLLKFLESVRRNPGRDHKTAPPKPPSGKSTPAPKSGTTPKSGAAPKPPATPSTRK